jgi:hypothetical protein
MRKPLPLVHTFQVVTVSRFIGSGSVWLQSSFVATTIFFSDFGNEDGVDESPLMRVRESVGPSTIQSNSLASARWRNTTIVWFRICCAPYKTAH